eukprot:TRINITY_DN2646_c0_g1_i1.p1 TRINITY_DN2646_c0_g1~~TRINITY_DN2646_c0_g1_i1.p1  ORF type:complete len:202 (-),score=12.77 TRINITY_DN2646_c0_g1_i1:302-907(-)
MASRSTFVALCLAFCLLSALNHPALAKAAAAKAPPTKAQIKAELNNMAGNISKNYPDYAQYATSFKKYINVALSSKFDFSALANASILIPSTKAAKDLNKKVPASSSNIPKLYNITAYQIIAQKYSLAQLTAFPNAQSLPTQLHKAIFKMGAAGGSTVQFANRATGAALPWATLMTARMYEGPYFVAHGVDLVTIPVGTKV